MKLFKAGSNLDEYKKLVDELRVLPNLLSVEESAIVMYVILFNSDEFLQLTDKDGLDDVRLMNEIMFESYISTTEEDFEIEELSKVLSKMALFCTYNSDWDVLAKCVPKTMEFASYNIVMTYTIEEEAWLSHQLRLVDEAFRSVPMGSDIMYEFMMHSLGVPLSRNYMANVFSVMLERVRRVFCSHPDFEEFSVSTQRNLLRTNCSLGLALYVVRGESLSGIEQVMEGMGELDEEGWRLNYGPVFDTPDKVAKVSIKNLLLFTPEQWTLFSTLVSVTQILVSNPDFFKLNFLYTLTQPQNEENEKLEGLSNLHFKYKMILKRRLKWKPDCISQNGEDPDQLVNKIFSCMDVLKQIAKLNDHIMMNSSAQIN